MTETLLDVRDLTIRLPRFDAVRGFSFSIRQGETLAVVGESGSGKSLSALAVMQLLPAAARAVSGTVSWRGTDLLRLSDREMRPIRGREIGMIFQEPMTSLNPVMTIGRQIAEVLMSHGDLTRPQAHRRAVELLDLVRIPVPQRRANEYPHQMSGGMRQRVMIAMAIACNPKLLIADEPTTALDVTVQAQILELLARLQSEMGMGILLISHDLDVVSQWADRVIVMYAGRKVEENDAKNLLGEALHPYTRGLARASPRLIGGQEVLPSRLTEIPGSIASAVGQPGCPFVPRCDLARGDCADAMPALTNPRPGQTIACKVVEGSIVS